MRFQILTFCGGFEVALKFQDAVLALRRLCGLAMLCHFGKEHRCLNPL